MLSSLGNPRQSLAQVLNFALVLSTAFMLWKGLSVFTASSSPIVVRVAANQPFSSLTKHTNTEYCSIGRPLRLDGTRLPAR